MMLTIFAAALFSPPAAAQPVKAAYLIYGDYGSPRRGGNLQRLLDEWAEQGVIRTKQHRVDPGIVEPCVPRQHYGSVHLPCVARQIADAQSGVPVVTIIARDSGRVTPVLDVTCIGPSGTGRATVSMNHGGAFSSISRERSDIRRAVANCIGAALQGSVVLR